MGRRSRECTRRCRDRRGRHSFGCVSSRRRRTIEIRTSREVCLKTSQRAQRDDGESDKGEDEASGRTRRRVTFYCVFIGRDILIARAVVESHRIAREFM